jgi:hypothetical protein
VSDPIGIRAIQKSYSIPWLDPTANLCNEFSHENTIVIGLPKRFVSKIDDVEKLLVFALKKALRPTRRISRQLLFKLDRTDKVHARKRSEIRERRLGSIASSNEQIQPPNFLAKIGCIRSKQSVALVFVAQQRIG